MAELKMPELNSVLIAGNLTKDPVIRQTRNGTPVANFSIASNRKFRDGDNQWQEDVCYVGVVAWNRLAESCVDKLRKGSAVLVEGELQSRTWQTDEGSTRSTVEIKARRIQFLNKRRVSDESVVEEHDDFSVFECDDDGFSVPATNGHVAHSFDVIFSEKVTADGAERNGDSQGSMRNATPLPNEHA